MFNYSPITYNTDVGSLCLNYLMGNTCGVGMPYWGDSFNLNTYYTLGNGFFPSIMYSGGAGYNIFTDTNWCNWQGKSNSANTSTSSSTSSENTFNIFKWGQEQETKSAPAKKTEKTSKSSSAATNPVKKTSSSNKKTALPNKTSSQTLGDSLVKNASKYMGLNEADGSWRKISNHKEWCADFIYYVIDETYKSQGKTVPRGLEKELPAGKPNHRVEELKQWGIDNGKFFQTSNKKNKAKLIAQNVKPGDILILREDGASHTGFVTEVNADGTFKTIEGNRNDEVRTATYSPDYHEISGFVQLRS